MSMMTSEKYELIQDKLEGLFRKLRVGCQTFNQIPTESNFYNTCPMDLKLNQSKQDKSLPVVIQFRGNPGYNKKFTFKFTFLVLSSVIVNVPFCHEGGGGERCKLDKLIVVS